MWKRILTLLLVFLPLYAAAEASLDDALDSIFEKYDTVGASVTVARDGEILYEHVFGLADKQQKRPVTKDTYFKAASVTKLVTAMRLMQLAEDGLIDLDAPLEEALGYPVLHPRHPEVPITLRMLMSHTSGLTGAVPSGETLSGLLGRKKSWGTYPPGTKWKYSNFAGAIGSVIEQVTGEDLNTAMQEGLFSPLGIDAAYRVHLLDAPEQAALRYNEKGRPARARNFYLEKPWTGLCDPEHHYDLAVGDLWITSRDLCRLGMLMCGGGTLDHAVLLTEETVEEMCSSQQGKGGITAESPYGLCVYRAEDLVAGRTLLGHQGHSDGILSNLLWDTESGLVFALMTNGCDTRSEDHITRLSREAFQAAWAAYGE